MSLSNAEQALLRRIGAAKAAGVTAQHVMAFKHPANTWNKNPATPLLNHIAIAADNVRTTTYARTRLSERCSDADKGLLVWAKLVGIQSVKLLEEEGLL